MTKRLILIRHAKSSWDDPFGDDHARQLNPRGRASATAIGKWMAAHGYAPDVVLCSDAARTQETADLILPQLTTPPEVALSAMLYHSAPDTVLDLIKRQNGNTVAVIAHNPGIAMLAHALVSDRPTHHRFSDYPTCATTVIDFDCDNWSAIQPTTGTCIDFIVPRGLIGDGGKDPD